MEKSHLEVLTQLFIITQAIYYYSIIIITIVVKKTITVVFSTYVQIITCAPSNYLRIRRTTYQAHLVINLL